MTQLTIEAPASSNCPPALRHKGLHGGQELARGNHARAAVLKEPGLRVVCAYEIQKTLPESASG